MERRDIEIPKDSPTEFLLDKHAKFLHSYVTNKEDNYEQLMVEYLKMSGIFWTNTALQLIKRDFEPDVQTEIIDLIRSCINSNGGISPAVGHDPHLLYTLSAIQLLISFGIDIDSPNIEVSIIDKEKTVAYIKSLQNADGSFQGDEWGEVDVRFSFCALASLALLQRLEAINLESAIDFVMRCYNQIDYGFGCRPESESHAGLIYCCLGSLSIAGVLDRVNADDLSFWLAERQLPSGGLNGRPEKLPDLCYSWWVLSSLAILGRLHWIDYSKLVKFILACQDSESGGFSDRPENMVDPFHTLFGIAGLSLLSHHTDYYKLPSHQIEKSTMQFFSRIKNDIEKVDPVFCMLQSVVQKRLDQDNKKDCSIDALNEKDQIDQASQ